MIRQTIKEGEAVESKTLHINVPHNWDNSFDSLSGHLTAVFEQQVATAVNHESAFAVLSDIDGCFLRFALNADNTKNIFETFFFTRCHSIFRAACATALAGQCQETFVLARPILEYAAAALLVHDEPNHQDTFLNRSLGKKGRQDSRDTFNHGQHCRVIASHDQRLKEIYCILYDQCIDFGSHPNEQGLVSGLEVEHIDEKTVFDTSYLVPGTIEQRFCMKALAETALCALRIFQFIFPERFMLLSITAKLDKLPESFKF